MVPSKPVQPITCTLGELGNRTSFPDTKSDNMWKPWSLDKWSHIGDFITHMQYMKIYIYISSSFLTSE